MPRSKACSNASFVAEISTKGNLGAVWCVDNRYTMKVTFSSPNLESRNRKKKTLKTVVSNIVRHILDTIPGENHWTEHSVFLFLLLTIRVHMLRYLLVIFWALVVLDSIIPKHHINVSAFISMPFTLTFSANVNAAGHSNWDCRSHDVSLFRHWLCVYPDTVTCDLSSHAASRNTALLQPKIAMVPMLCPAQKQYFPGSVHIACCDLWNITPLKYWVIHCRERYTLWRN